ncbi:MAG: sensor histidine kinase [Stomatobaculum sp.]
MKPSLYLKFLLGYLFFGVAGFIAVATLSSRLTYNYLIRSRSRTLYDEASLIASTYSTVYQGNHIDLANAYPQLRAVATYLQAQIWVMDRGGNIIVDSDGKRDDDIIPNFDPTATGTRSYMVGSYFGSFPYQVLSVSAPITGNYRTYGYVVIHLPMDRVQDSANEILNIVYITFGIVFLLSLSILLLFGLFVYRPLKVITEGARQFADGALSYRIRTASSDEMGYLANTMNYMAEQLERSEEDERKFISNVSHDFRSPLTSIKGYLEAILDGTIPEEMQEKYLKRVIGETERLTGLTQRMLTLNSLDNDHGLSRSSFDINRVIRSTAESFEGQCTARRIRLDLSFAVEKEMVYADLGKIQQVLYNLIDNAIKFSPSDSTIDIQSYENRGKIFVSVRDRGCGIPKKDRSRVFDRFYKSDRSRGKDKKGTGLGLAIVREIIQAHGENIDLISTEGVGSEFIFSLPSASASSL